jgi:hypothetical protein
MRSVVSLASERLTAPENTDNIAGASQYTQESSQLTRNKLKNGT